MKKITTSIILLLLLFCSRQLSAQILTPVKWSYAFKRLSPTEAVVLMRATMDDGWHVYSQTGKEGGPVKTTFTFTKSNDYQLIGRTIEPTPITKLEKVFDMEISYFEHSVTFQQKVYLKKKGVVNVKGTLQYMTCNDQKCLPPEDVPFIITVK